MDELSSSMLSISTGFSADSDLVQTLTRMCELAVTAVPGCDFAGITLMQNGRPATAAFTDSASPDIDSAQYESGEGPCLAAFHDRVPYSIDDTRTDRRWPAFAAAAESHGILSTLSVPLSVAGNGLGALNMYSAAIGSFRLDDLEATELFASQAAAVLANAQAYWAAHALSAQLQEALVSRSVIDQAKGMLMAEHGCSADEAFQLLREMSQQQNRKVRLVAEELVHTRGRGG